jgi:hypothetical protein
VARSVATAVTTVEIIDEVEEEDEEDIVDVRDELEKDAFCDDLETYLEDGWDAAPRQRRICPQENQAINQACDSKLLLPLADRLPPVPKVPRKPPWKPRMKEITATAIEWTKASAGPGYLSTVLAPVWQFLEKADAFSLCAVDPNHLRPLYGSVRLSRPDCLVYKRRRFGFGWGKATIDITTENITPSPYLILHQVWDFLNVQERQLLVKADKAFHPYAIIRQRAASRPLFHLKQQRLDPAMISLLSVKNECTIWGPPLSDLI